MSEHELYEQQNGHAEDATHLESEIAELADGLFKSHGILEFKKKSTFSAWVNVFVVLQGKWMFLFKSYDSRERIGSLELSRCVSVQHARDRKGAVMYPRRFSLCCVGGALPSVKWHFRASSKKEKEMWNRAIAWNCELLSSAPMNTLFPTYNDLERLAHLLLENLLGKAKRRISKKFKNCFFGSDAVNFMFDENIAASRADAINMGRQMLNAGFMQHITCRFDFTDSQELYRFTLGANTEILDMYLTKQIDPNKHWCYVEDPFSNGEIALIGNSQSPLHMAQQPTSPASSEVSSAASDAFQNPSSTVSEHSASSHRTSHDDEQSEVHYSTDLNGKNGVVEVLKPRDHWRKSDDEKECHCCNKRFSALKRKHHCRKCGNVICSSCSTFMNFDAGSSGNQPTRLCLECVQNIRRDVPSVVEPVPVAINVERSVHSDSSSIKDSVSVRESYDSTRDSYRSQDIAVIDTGICCSKCHPTQSRRNLGYFMDFMWENPWPRPPIPSNELDRLNALNELEILDTSKDPAFNSICEMASIALACPIIAISFIDQTRQWIKASEGMTESVIPRDISLCAYTIMFPQTLICSDLTRDVRFSSNPMVTGPKALRFYASVPVVNSTGYRVGTIMAADTKPRSCENVGQLEVLARRVSKLISQIEAKQDTSNAPKRVDYIPDNIVSIPSVTPTPPVPMSSPPVGVTANPALAVMSNSVASKPVVAVATNPTVPEGPVAEAREPTTIPAQVGTNASEVKPDLETQLMMLLSKNTDTQANIRSQQGVMIETLGNHSKKISDLSSKLLRMEQTLAAAMQ